MSDVFTTRGDEPDDLHAPDLDFDLSLQDLRFPRRSNDIKTTCRALFRRTPR